METREEKIRALAYDIWKRNGEPEGQELAHWDEAARIVDEQNSIASQAPTDPTHDGRNRA